MTMHLTKPFINSRRGTSRSVSGRSVWRWVLGMGVGALIVAVNLSQFQEMSTFSVASLLALETSVIPPTVTDHSMLISTTTFPAMCTPNQLDTIAYQLPAETCSATQKRPWTNKCSFSYASQCPKSDWLTDYYTAVHTTSSNQQHAPPRRIAFSVGCNKGMDAVNTLRMLSADTGIDKDAWKQAFFGNTSSSATQEFEAGRC
jgi:hypothetical protein